MFIVIFEFALMECSQAPPFASDGQPEAKGGTTVHCHSVSRMLKAFYYSEVCIKKKYETPQTLFP